MSDQRSYPPTHSPIDDSSSSDRPPYPRWPAFVAWLVIILVAGFIILSNEYPSLRGRTATPGHSPLQMNLMGKYSVGMTQLKRDVGPELLQQTRDNAVTIEDQIDVAILAGELVGKDEALKYLDATPVPTTRMVQVFVPHGATAAATQTAAAFPLPPTTGPTTLAEQVEPTSSNRAQWLALQQLYRGGADSLSDAQRSSLVERADFFSRLALSFGKPQSDPQRAAVLHEAKFSAAVLAGFLIGLGLFMLIGFVLLVLAIVFYFTGTLKLRYRPQPLLPPVYVEMFAAYLLLFVGGALLVTKFGGAKLGLNASWLLTPIVPMAMGWGVMRGLRWRDVLDGLGWFRGSGFFIEVPMGIVGYITGLPVIAVGIGLSLLLSRLTHATASHPIQSAFGNAAAWQLYGIAAVWAPIVEETFFRGALFNHLRQRWNWPISASVVALIFAAIHPQGLTFIPALGSIAIVLAGIREWRGTVISSIVAHGLNNATVVTLMLLTM